MQTVICDSIIGLECAESESESPGLESSTPKSMDLSTLSDQSINEIQDRDSQAAPES